MAGQNSNITLQDISDQASSFGDLAPALVAIADLFSAANTELNGNSADVRVEVKGNFKSGSFQMASQPSFAPWMTAIS